MLTALSLINEETKRVYNHVVLLSIYRKDKNSNVLNGIFIVKC